MLQFWDQYRSAPPRLPAITLLDASSHPRGLSDADFVRLLRRLTLLREWQAWDVRNLLDPHCCGFVGCKPLALLVLLLSACSLRDRLVVVQCYGSALYATFLGRW